MSSDTSLWSDRSSDLFPLTIGMVCRAVEWQTIPPHTFMERWQDCLKTFRQRPSWANGWMGFHYTPITVVTALASDVDYRAAETAMHWQVPVPRDAQAAEENPQLHRCQVLVAVPSNIPDPQTPGRWTWSVIDARTHEGLLQLWEATARTRQLLESPEPATREWAKSEVAGFLTQKSDVLIALCHEPPAVGVRSYDDLTDRMVAFHREGLPDLYCPRENIIDPVEPKPVYFLPPSGDPRPINRVLKRTLLRFYRLNQLNQRIVADRPAWLAALQGERSFLQAFPEAQRDPFRKQQICRVETVCNDLHPAEQTIFRQAAVVDWLALSAQQQTTSCRLWLVLLMLLAALCHALASASVKSPTAWTILMTMHGLLVAGAAVCFAWVSSLRLADNYLEYRGLAEGLRVALFWRIAGLAARVSESYLRLQRDDLAWIRDALRGCDLQLLVQTSLDRPPREMIQLKARSEAEGVALASREWVLGQADYHDKAVTRNRRRDRFWTLLTWSATVGALTVSTLSLLFFLLPLLGKEVGPGATTQWWLNVLIILPQMAFIFGRVRSDRGFGELALRSQRMGPIFIRSVYLLAKFLDAKFRESGAITEAELKGGRQVLLELGRDALAENGDWIAFQRRRPLRLYLLDEGVFDEEASVSAGGSGGLPQSIDAAGGAQLQMPPSVGPLLTGGDDVSPLPPI